MPWTTKQAREKNSKIRSDSEAKMWVKVANKTLRAELEKGTGQEEAEARAIRAANGALRNMHAEGGVSVKAGRRAYVLLSSETGPFLTLGATEADGVSIHRYRKEVIKVGDYVKDEEGLSFSVTPDTLNHWASTFKRMRSNGVKVRIPLGHPAHGDPEKNLGEVEDLIVDGDGLVMICGLVGDGAPTLAERNDVSIYVPPSFTDGKKNKYVRPIRHIALTPDPVIPGLGPWKRLAASFLTLKKEPEMAVDLKKLGTALGIEAELTEKNAVELILSAAGTLQQRVVDLEAEVKAAKAEPAADPVKIEPVKVDPTLLCLARENRQMKLNTLVEAAKITPAVRDALAKLYVNEAPLTLALSHGGDVHDHFGTLVGILAENNPVELAEKTGPQVLALANTMAAGENPLVKDAERRAAAKAG